MNVLSLDTEVTTHNKGHPFDDRNVLVCYSYASSSSPTDNGARRVLNEDVGDWQTDLVDRIHFANRIVGFNFKFDYHWFRKAGIELSGKQIYDVQIGWYLYKNQTQRWPSLDQVCEDLGIGKKLDIVKTEYWDKGIDTTDIPWEVLEEYATLDAVLTLKAYEKLMSLMSPAQIRRWGLAGQDLEVLEEMEWNGLHYDVALCEKRATELDRQIQETSTRLAHVYPDVPVNFNSGDHLSAFLYGGIVKEDGKEFIGYYKTGQKAGQPKYKNIEISHELPRLFKPLKGTELKKEGFYATNEPTLRKLKGSKKAMAYIEDILNLSKYEKLNGTYYRGLPSKAATMNWKPEGVLHGAFHQVSTGTGRLSSSDPNLQNFASSLQDIFITRYPTEVHHEHV